ncbi:MAG: hypothetical protein HC846_09220 [Blastocatellia bacterium]|nr:hypothetical protein [Blastocatellia bacterium]
MFLLQNEADGVFDWDAIWNSMFGLIDSFLSRLPFIIVAVIVFRTFLSLSGKIFSRAIHTAGQRTRLDITLADLLGRLASFPSQFWARLLLR